MSGVSQDEKVRASLTAVTAAVFRAAHLALDDDPKVFVDPFALSFSGVAHNVSPHDHAGTVLEMFTARLGPKAGPLVFRYLRALMIMRNRYAEDMLLFGIERGLRRYVILGAGLDSFAYRRPDLAGRIQVVEIDHPATQKWKRQRLVDLGLRQPFNLISLPIDLSEQNLLDELSRGDITREPVFLSWLGVTQYLRKEAVLRNLQLFTHLASGTEIVFSYIVPHDTLNEENQALFTIFGQSTANRGEPWKTFFKPAELMRQLQELGYKSIENLTPEEANARYFADRKDALHVPGLEHVMRVQVG